MVLRRRAVCGLGRFLVVLLAVLGGAALAGPAAVPLATGAPPVAPDWGLDGQQPHAHLGEGVSAAGDLNGDGYTDLVVAAPWYDGDRLDEGRIVVHYGSAEGPQVEPAWSYAPDQYGAHLGLALAAAGDVNGDGFDDLLVAAPDWDNGHTNAGRALLFLGSPEGLGPLPAWSVEGTQSGERLGCVRRRGRRCQRRRLRGRAGRLPDAQLRHGPRGALPGQRERPGAPPVAGARRATRLGIAVRQFRRRRRRRRRGRASTTSRSARRASTGAACWSIAAARAAARRSP